MKKFISMVLMIVVAMGLVGCTSGEADTSSGGSESSTSSNATFYPSSDVDQITLADAQATISDSINITDELDTDDWYEIVLDKSGTYTIYTNILEGTASSAGWLTIDFQILDQYGSVVKLISQYHKSAALVNTFIAPDIGTYYIHIRRVNNYDTQYSFEIQPSMDNGLIQDSEGEYNDVISMATPLSSEEIQNGVSGSVNITKNSDYNDWYIVILSQTGTYTIYTNILEGTAASGPDNTVDFQVLDQYGSVIKSISQNHNNVALVNTFTATDIGTYYIHINRGNNYDTRYNFQIVTAANETTKEINVDGEYNDVISMATPVTYDFLQKGLSGSVNITKINDYNDWYKVDLSETGIYTIYTNILEGTASSAGWLTIDFQILDQYGSVVKLISQYHNSAALVNTFTAPDIGTYYIHISRVNNYATRYSFQIVK